MSDSKSLKKRKHYFEYGGAALIVFVILLSSYSFIIARHSVKALNPVTTATSIQTTGTLKVVWPNSKQAAVGVLGYGLLASNGTQSQTPTASIAKVVTALAVLKKYPLELNQQGPTITLTAADVSDYQTYQAESGSVVNVVVGEHITEYQALEAMLLPSANNMADSLAIWAFGSIPNYTTFANQMVTAMGLNNTHITDASGFSPSTVSTAIELITIGEAALNNPVLAQIVDKPNATVPVAGVINNVDWFVDKYNLIGIKTGNTDQAGGCFLSAAQYTTPTGNIIVIGAVMNAPNLQTALDETIPMLQSVQAQIQAKTIPVNTSVSKYNVPWQGSVAAVTSKPLQISYLPGMTINYSQNVRSINSPSFIGTPVGNASLRITGLNSSVVAPIMLSQTVKQPSFVWKFFHPRYVI